MPSGKTARPNITDNKDGTITVRYAPTEKGLHQMGIKYDGNHIPGESGAGLRGAHSDFLLIDLLSLIIIEHVLCADTCEALGRLVSWWETPSAQMQGLAGRLWEGVGVQGGLRQPLSSLLTQPPFPHHPQGAPCSSTWTPSTAATSAPMDQA